MALYLSPWFSLLAALGVQLALVIVAWLFGASREGRRAVLVGVYIITAIVSIAFSYVSLDTWFGERERPALAQRALYDELNAVASRTEPLLSGAVASGHRYTLALEEMAAAEKQHGHISQSRDAEPYLDAIRAAVANEARSVGGAYNEGSGAGVRYTAFSRHAQLTRQTTSAIESAWQAIARAKAELKPGMPTDAQLRQFHVAYDAIPWSQVERLLGSANLERPVLPAYARFVERSGSGQEDLMRSFEELLTRPSARNVFSAALAAFIDIIVFLLAFAAGPYLHGEPEQRWLAAGAVLDAHDSGQDFARELLRKIRPDRRGMPRLPTEGLTAGQQQMCLLLTGGGQAALQRDEDGLDYYVLSPETHRRLAESVHLPKFGLSAREPGGGQTVTGRASQFHTLSIDIARPASTVSGVTPAE